MFSRRIQCGIVQVSVPTKNRCFLRFSLFFVSTKIQAPLPFPHAGTRRPIRFLPPPSLLLPTPIAASSSALAASPIPPATSPPASPNRRPLPRLSSLPPAPSRPATSMVSSFSPQSSPTLGFSGPAAGRGFGTPRCACSGPRSGRVRLEVGFVPVTGGIVEAGTG